MGLETVDEIADFNVLWPLTTDPRSEGDDHFRNLKIAMLALSRTMYNPVINGCMRVQQRVTTPLTLVKDAYGYGTVDRFEGMATGTAVSAGTLTATATSLVGRTGVAAKFSGMTLTGTGVLWFRHRIEADDAIAWKDQAAVFSVNVYHDVGSNVNYTLYVRKANAKNNFGGGVTEIGNSGQTAVVTATATRLKFAVADLGDCSNGLELEIKIEAGAVTTKNFDITEFQLNNGTISVPFAWRPIGVEMDACLWFFERIEPQASDQRIAAGQALDIDTAHCVLHYRRKRLDTPTEAHTVTGTWKMESGAGDDEPNSSMTVQNLGRESCLLVGNASTTIFSAGDGVNWHRDATDTAYIDIIAELT